MLLERRRGGVWCCRGCRIKAPCRKEAAQLWLETGCLSESVQLVPCVWRDAHADCGWGCGTAAKPYAVAESTVQSRESRSHSVGFVLPLRLAVARSWTRTPLGERKATQSLRAPRSPSVTLTACGTVRGADVLVNGQCARSSLRATRRRRGWDAK
eukprot:1039809-Prymnesium_polylepis.1